MGRSTPSYVSTPAPPSPGEVASIFDSGGYIPHSPLSCTSHGSDGWLNYNVSSPMVTESVGLFSDECPLVENRSDTWILSEMSMEEIVDTICEHGCADFTDRLSLSECQDLPFKTSSLGNFYHGALCTGQQIVIKCLRPVIHQTSSGHQILKRAAEELYMWSQCQHPNVLQLFGVAQYRKQLAMISPWMSRGTLDCFLSLNLPSIPDRYKLCRQIAEGVTYLHEMGIVHGDIKAANILVSADHRAVLAEFGNSIIRDHSIQSNFSTVGVDLSIRWTAPEALEGQGIPTIESDIYALGMTILVCPLTSPPHPIAALTYYTGSYDRF
ncbi:unnamed protein product [Rhizoctonia solani]|uniref:Protein kinase domain-containing protein n=1 Tax=Rhizoctonia solani TaxID=456999 RepID=A0A8H3B126_9AGAM|nr:unnamed protein product [Rhizoctonia solani]